MKKIWNSFALIAVLVSQGAHATSYTYDLHSGRTLYAGDELVSNNQIYHLIQQGDGNLVLYKSGVAIWATFQNGSYAAMQGDGNFVQYSGATPVWASNTGQPSGPSDNNYGVSLKDDGTLFIHGAYALVNVYEKVIIPAGVTLGGGGTPCQMRPFPVCVFPGTPSQYDSSVSACSQSDAATYASQHGWNYGACH
jgi:hypothetical protein